MNIHSKQRDKLSIDSKIDTNSEHIQMLQKAECQNKEFSHQNTSQNCSEQQQQTQSINNQQQYVYDTKPSNNFSYKVGKKSKFINSHNRIQSTPSVPEQMNLYSKDEFNASNRKFPITELIYFTSTKNEDKRKNQQVNSQNILEFNENKLSETYQFNKSSGIQSQKSSKSLNTNEKQYIHNDQQYSDNFQQLSTTQNNFYLQNAEQMQPYFYTNKENSKRKLKSENNSNSLNYKKQEKNNQIVNQFIQNVQNQHRSQQDFNKIDYHSKQSVELQNLPKNKNNSLKQQINYKSQSAQCIQLGQIVQQEQCIDKSGFNHNIPKQVFSAVENIFQTSQSARQLSNQDYTNRCNTNIKQKENDKIKSNQILQDQRNFTTSQVLNRKISNININKEQSRVKSSSPSIISYDQKDFNKQKIACDDACIPMNVVSQYNINENISLPYESFSQFVLNPYNFKLSQKQQIISIQNQFQETKKRFISEENIKTSTSTPTSNKNQVQPIYQSHFFQKKSLQKINPQTNQLPFQNSTILDKMQSQSALDNQQTIPMEQISQQESSINLKNQKLGKETLKQFSKLLLKSSEQIKSSKQFVKNLNQSSSLKNSQIINHLNQNCNQSNNIQISKMQQAAISAYQIDNEMQLSPLIINQEQSNYENQCKKGNVVKVLKSFTKISKRLEQVVTKLDESIDQEEYDHNVIQSKNFINNNNNNNNEQQTNFKIFQNVSQSPSLYEQMKPKSIMTNRNKTSFINNYFQQNQQNQVLTPKESLSKLSPKIQYFNDIKNKSYSLSMPSNTILNRNVEKFEIDGLNQVESQFCIQNLQQRNETQEDGIMINKNDQAQTTHTSKKQTIITFKNNKQKPYTQNKSIVGETKIFQLLKQIKNKESLILQNDEENKDEDYNQQFDNKEQVDSKKIYGRIEYKSINSIN